MDRKIRFDYASVDGDFFESGKKKLRIQKYRIRVDGALNKFGWILEIKDEGTTQTEYMVMTDVTTTSVFSNFARTKAKFNTPSNCESFLGWWLGCFSIYNEQGNTCL